MSEAEIADPKRMMVELRKASWSVGEIASRLGVEESEVNDELERLFRTKAVDLTDDDTTMELERLETLNRGNWAKAIAGDSAALTSVLRIQKRRTELLDSAKEKPRLTPAQDLNRSMRELVSRTRERSAGLGSSEEL